MKRFFPLWVFYFSAFAFLAVGLSLKINDSLVTNVKKSSNSISISKPESSSSKALRKTENSVVSPQLILKSAPTVVPPTLTDIPKVDFNNSSSIRLDLVSPNTAINNQQIILKGSGFGFNMGKVWFYNDLGGNVGGPRIDSWSDTEIKTGVYFVRGPRTFYLEVETASGGKSNKIPLIVSQGQPYILSVNPTVFTRGSRVIIQGTEFGSSGNVKFYTASNKGWDNFVLDGINNSWTDTEIQFTVPSSLEVKEYGIQIQTSDGRTSSFKFYRVE